MYRTTARDESRRTIRGEGHVTCVGKNESAVAVAFGFSYVAARLHSSRISAPTVVYRSTVTLGKEKTSADLDPTSSDVCKAVFTIPRPRPRQRQH